MRKLLPRAVLDAGTGTAFGLGGARVLSLILTPGVLPEGRTSVLPALEVTDSILQLPGVLLRMSAGLRRV